MLEAICNHPQYPNIIDAIEKWGNKPKSKLIAAVYNKYENYTRHELRKMNRGQLLAILIKEDRMWPSTYKTVG